MSRCAFLFLGVTITLLSPGCGLVRREKPDGGVSISRKDLASLDRTREALRHFAHRYAVNVQSAAERIVQEARDVETRRQAVLWQLFAAEQGRDAAFQHDILAAFVDMWILCVQMREFFESGEGRVVFGEHSRFALEAAREIEADISRVTTAILPSNRVSQVRTSVQEFASEHPIRFPFARDADVSFLDQAEGDGGFSWMYDGSLSPLRAIAGLDETAMALLKLSEVGSQASLVASYLPHRARLETQLLLYEPDVQSALASLRTISEGVDRISVTAGELPEEMSRQIERAIEELRKSDEVVKDMLARLTAFLADLQKTSVDVGHAGVAWQGTTKAIHDMVNDFRGKREGDDAAGPASIQPAAVADPATRPAPYDINDYGKAAREIAAAAAQLRGATAEVKALLSADTPAVVTAAGEIEGLVDRVALYGVLLVLAFFGGLIAYRVVAARFVRAPR